MLFRAIEFAAKSHAGQYRKGSGVPYMSHIMNVCKTLCEYNCPEDVIVAGVLHDTVEDTYVTLKDIELLFGRRVSDIVRGATEPEKLESSKNGNTDNWKQRKTHSLDYLKNNAPADVLLVWCADKLDNISTIKYDIDAKGESVWERFSAGKDEQEWYYTSLAEIFLDRAGEIGEPLFTIAERYNNVVKEVFYKQEGDFLLYETRVENIEDLLRTDETDDIKSSGDNQNE